MGVWELYQGIAVAFQNPSWFVQRAIRRTSCDQQPLGELPVVYGVVLLLGTHCFDVFDPQGSPYNPPASPWSVVRGPWSNE
jgi:hypothetical protein